MDYTERRSGQEFGQLKDRIGQERLAKMAQECRAHIELFLVKPRKRKWEGTLGSGRQSVKSRRSAGQLIIGQ